MKLTHLFVSIVLLFPVPSVSQDVESTETRILPCVKGYATTMIERGRDDYGKEHSPLFASALNHKTLRVDSSIQRINIPGVRPGDRSITGSNPLHDKYLYSTLYLLSETTGDSRFGKAADEALTYFFTTCQSPNTGLMAWGEHIYWDFLADTIGYEEKAVHEAEAWPLWDRVYALAPDAAYQYAVGLWKHQVADQQTGDFSRHAGWRVHNPQRGADYPRYAGQMIEVWADAYARPENRNRSDNEVLLNAIEVMLDRMEQNRLNTGLNYLPAFRGAEYVWMDSNIELARCLANSMQNIDDPELREQLSFFTDKLDRDFFKAPHLVSSGGGFAVTLDAELGNPIHRSTNRPYTRLWESGYGYITSSYMANKCFARYGDLVDRDKQLAEKYRELILRAGAQYLSSKPDTPGVVKPVVFADAIDLMLNCHTLTEDRKFLTKALTFSELAIDIFFGHGSPLPKATNKHQHYESITGGPELLYAMLKAYNTGMQANR